MPRRPAGGRRGGQSELQILRDTAPHSLRWCLARHTAPSGAGHRGGNQWSAVPAVPAEARQRASRGLIALAAVGLIAAAPVTAASATTEPPAASGAEGKVTDFLGYVGGPGGAASGDPIRIGYINQDGGSIVVSSTHDDGVDFAVQFINEQAGGIGGRPIEIVQCFIANTEEEGQQCGQQFANDD